MRTVLIATATAFLTTACHHDSPVELDRHERTDPELLRLIETSGARGPVLVGQVPLSDGRVRTQVLSGPDRLRMTTNASGRVLSSATTQQGPADAPAEDLFFTANPRGGFVEINGVQMFPTERRDSTQRAAFLFFCCDQVTGVCEQLFNVRVVSLVHTRVSDTGGHEDQGHTGQDSVGFWKPDNGQVTDGVFESTYFTSIVSQDERLEVTWTDQEPESACDGQVQTDTYRTATRLQEPLVQVSDSSLLTFDSICSPHFNVSYVTEGTEERLLEAAENYFLETGDKLRVNAASLVFGGLNAIAGEWDTSGGEPYGGASGHKFHRIGAGVDLDNTQNPTTTEFDEILRATEEAGFRRCVPEGTHVHCDANEKPYSQF